MNEKRFFRLALEQDLLNGDRVKRRIDAQLAVENRTAFRTVRQGNGARTASLSRWITVPAVAVLLALIVGIGVFVGTNGMRSRSNEAALPTEPGTAPSATQDRQIVTGEKTDVRLLDAIDPEGTVQAARTERLGLAPYDEADWAWIREITASATELSANAGTVNWTAELRLPKGEWTENPFLGRIQARAVETRCFFAAGAGLDTPDEGALLDFAFPGPTAFVEEDDAWVVCIPMVYAMPQVYDTWPAALPPTGEVTVTCRLILLDRAGDAMGDVYASDGENSLYAATVGEVQETFTFDAEALLNIADPVHIDVPLSGEYVLSTHIENGFRNERVSLDGVTLDAEIHYTREGVYVILPIKDAGALSEAQQTALYLAINGGPDGDTTVTASASTEAEALQVYRLSRAFWGTTRFGRYCIILDPVRYAASQSLTFSISATYAAGEAGSEPTDDWSWTGRDGALPSLNHVSALLASFEIPLPDVADPLTGKPFAEAEPNPTGKPMDDDRTEIYVWFTDDAEQVIDGQLQNAYPDYTQRSSDQTMIEEKRARMQTYYQTENRRKCLELCEEGDILFISSFSPMCIIRVPQTSLDAITANPNVVRIDGFVQMYSTASNG